MHGSAGQNWGRIGVAAALVIMALGSTATPIAAQGLEDYDYTNLGLRGIGLELFSVDASQNESTIGIGAKLDLGFLGPNIRVVTRLGYWKADVDAGQVSDLEAQLEEASGLDAGTIDLGTIDRSAYIFGTDFQWTTRNTKFSPYIGVGLDVYLLNDDGDAIRDTFLDDNVVTAGVSGVIGAQVALSRRWNVYGEFRGAAVTDASNVGVAVGLSVMTGN